MKKILGLDLGTNSIGWALIEYSFNDKIGKIIKLGSRIIPMSQDVLDNFGKGQSHSQTSERTGYRSTRKLYQRHILRRERLHRVLNVLSFLPDHYAKAIDFTSHPGKFLKGKEPKINYRLHENGEYEFIFENSFQEMLNEFNKSTPCKNIPKDWTLYYLRKKALIAKISKEELAWVILNFNQKRGYYQLRGEEEEIDNNKSIEYCELIVEKVIENGEQIKGNQLFNVEFSNGWIYDRPITKPENWIGKTKEFIVTTTETKNGEIKRTFKAVDSEQDWIAIKKKSEQDILKSKLTVGEYIYNSLLLNPSQKIKGKLVRTIERKFYKEELNKILQAQSKFHPEIKNPEFLNKCIQELYPLNEAHTNMLKSKDIVYLIMEDIIFYQRPLKSKKSTIAKCPYEFRTFYKPSSNKTEGKFRTIEGIQVIAKSNPYFQEFRLWQFLKSLRIYKLETYINNKKVIDYDVTGELIQNVDRYVEIFEFLNSKKDIDQSQMIDFFIKKGEISKAEKDNYRWNYVSDKKYPCNETRSLLLSKLKNVTNLNHVEFLNFSEELKLWHIIYSVKDKIEYKKALKKYAEKKRIDIDSFVSSFEKIPPFTNDYGAYSEKAIKKLLPLMRAGKYWDINKIDDKTQQRINNIINGQVDETIKIRTREKAITLNSVEEFSNLPLWLVCYVVYDRHSEALSINKWKSPDDIDRYISSFKQYSLNNPIVEQVTLETLRVIKDIWINYGESKLNFFNEIHIELGRDLKNPKKIREQISRKVNENEITNNRIRELLKELMSDNTIDGDIRPYSPSHQEILKIYEEGIYHNPNAIFDNISQNEIDKIRRNTNPSKSEITKYKLWLEQGYCSPYTGKTIPLSRLFTTDYQIEHVIPQAKYFDDSLSNKIICESEVNDLKKNRTAYAFIKDEKGRIVELRHGKTVSLFSVEQFEDHCSKYFKSNKIKLKKLLSEEVPEGFIERQLNDSRYISKLIKNLISHIVKDESESDAISKNVIPVSGAITSKLKHDWGLYDKWNEIITPRFERLNKITQSNNFGSWDNSINAFRPTVPDELRKDFSAKRIDHRHHALDALVIACTDRRHVHYLNALNSESNNYSLRDSLLIKNKDNKYTKHFLLPWKNFPIEAKQKLQKTTISFKQNQRIINKTNNKTWKYIQVNGAYKKVLVKQTKGDNWAIRKPLHKETVSGNVKVRLIKEVSFANALKDWQNIVDKELKGIIKKLVLNGHNSTDILNYFKSSPYLKDNKPVAKVKLYYYTSEATAVRTKLDSKFTQKQLEKVTDNGICSILTRHVNNYINNKEKPDFELAFSPEGIEELNKNIQSLNGGKPHQPIYKVRIFEEGNKFNIGYTGNKKAKFVEAAKGTNLFFAIYFNQDKNKRVYETIPLNVVIEHQKQTAHLPKNERTPVPVNPEKGKLLFTLSPNDLVYVPTLEEQESPHLVDFKNLGIEQFNRIYKMVSTTQDKLECVPHYYSIGIIKNEIGSNNKSQNTIDDNSQIKAICWKLKIDRIGNISLANI